MSSDSTANAFSPGKPRIMKIARGLAYSLVAVAVLCAAAVGVMSTAWFQNSLKETVKSRLEDLTGGRVEMQAMRFNPFILQVSIQGLTVRGSETSSALPLFSAGTVVARLNLVPLARRRVRFRSLDFGKAKLHVATGSDGTTNFPGPKGSSAAERAADELIDLAVGRLTLGQTQIEWNDRQLPFQLRGKELALLRRRNRGHRYTGTIPLTTKRIVASSASLRTTRSTSTAPDSVPARQHAEPPRLSRNAAAGSAHGRAEAVFRDPSAEYPAPMQIQGLDLSTALRSFLAAQPLLSSLRFPSRV